MKAERVLRLYLRSNWPGQDGACPWALLTPDLRVIERGNSGANGWPVADECEAVVTADQVSWLSISLPAKLGRDAHQIVAYALEEKLLEPLDAMHFIVGKAEDPNATPAIVIKKTRLREILDTVSAAGRRIDRLYTEMQLAPAKEGQWTVCRFDDTAFLRIGAHLGLAIDWTSAAPPDSLMLAIARARSRGDLPERVVVAAPAELIPDLEAWSAALGLPVTTSVGFDPLVASTAGANNLLTGAFAPPGEKGFVLRYLRLSAIALLLAGIGHTVLSLADWAWLAHQAAGLNDDAVAIYREAVPNSSAPLLNPSLQLRREAAAVLRERGRLGDGEMLTMLALLGGELPPGVKLRRLQFDRSILEIVAVVPDDAVPRIAATLRLRGYAVDATTLRQVAAGTEYQIRMRLR
jgi:general secretion pathway protein L